MTDTVREYHPELIPRRGEWLAWLLTALVSAGWLIVRLTGNPVMGVVVWLDGLLLLSALSISLGNWVDRRTCLRLDGNGVAFENGLRRVRLGWEEIRQVQVYSSNWGDKVEVIGPDAHFAFRTLGEVKAQGKLQGRMGFAEGQDILKEILKAAHLHEVNDQVPEGARYYSR